MKLESFKVGRRIKILCADRQQKAAQHLGEFGVITRLVDSKGFYTVKLESGQVVRCRFSNII